jgi:flagellar protein FliJ
MRNMHALIRLARYKVEELQRQQAAIDDARQSLRDQVDRLQAAVPEEQVAANASRDGFVAYGSYAQAVIQRRRNIQASLADVDVQAEALRARLEAAFAELKKFEIMEERRLVRVRRERAQAEQAGLDDLSVMRAARRA